MKEKHVIPYNEVEVIIRRVLSVMLERELTEENSDIHFCKDGNSTRVDEVTVYVSTEHIGPSLSSTRLMLD